MIVQFGDQISEGSPFSVAPRRISFTTDVHPLFEEKGCLDCHSGPGAEANLRVDTKANLLHGDSQHGPVVLLRNSAESTLIQKLGPNPPFGARMPKDCDSNCLTEEELLMISDWIDEGGDI